MGFLDGALHGLDLLAPFSGPGRAQRRAARIQEEGTASPGTLTGIKVRGEAEAGTAWWFAFEVRPAGAAPFRAAVRQARPPDPWDVLRLGAALEVRHDGEDAVIAWDPAGPGAWRPVREVDDGIDDTRLRPVRGEPGEAEVRGWRPATLLGMGREEVDLLLAVDGAEPAWHTTWVPEWAGHLCAVGTTLPAGVRDGGARVRVDWRAALARHGTGAGVPRPAPTEAAEAGTAVEDRTHALVARLTGAAPDDGTSGDPHGVSFGTWVAVSASLVRDGVPPARYDEHAARHGVPPGAWASAEAVWKGRAMSDWRIGAAFGEAYAKAVKGR